MQIGLSLSLTAQLRSSSTYAVLGYDPALVFDFKNSYYRKSGDATTFSSAITHSASSTATMVDSDGLLKWRPHNLLTHSGDLTNANWTNNALTVTTGQNDFEGNPTAFKLTPTAVSGLHRFYKTIGNSNLVNGKLATVTIDLKADGYNFFSVASTSGYYAIFNLSDGTVSLDTNSVSPTVTSLGNGWYRCSINPPGNSQEVFSVGETSQAVSFGSQTFTGDGTSGVLVAYPHSFRSDLGGMVNNPDTNSSYVPTTSAVVYASRRGHHIYNGSAWVNEGILHESEARTNLLTYSNDFANSDWTKARLTITANQATAPDGTVTADEIGITGSASNSYGINSTASTTGTLSYFAKQNTEQFFLIVRGGYAAGDWAIFDLSAGTVSKSPTFTDSSAHMVPMGNGWYRCVLQSAQASTVNAFSISGSGTSNTTTTSGTVYLWGAQMEAGSTPSSYIPTTTATATRAAETLTIPAANLPYNSTNMSIQIDGKMTYADSDNVNEVQPYYWLLNGSNYIYARIDTTGTRTGQPSFLQGETTSGNDFVNGSASGYSPGTNVPFNLASRNGSTFINGASKGTLLTANTTPTALPDLSSTNLQLGQLFMGTIGQFRMWSDDITDAGITEAST